MTGKVDLSVMDVAALASHIEECRMRYVEARELLVGVMTQVQQYPSDAADSLLDHAEEYGSANATQEMQRDRGLFGEPRDEDMDPLPEEQRAEIEDKAEKVLEARDDLDRATAERENRMIEKDPSRHRVVNVGGKEFEIDTVTRELRAMEDKRDRHSLDEPTRGGRALTPTEEMRLRADIEQAQPREPEPRDRVR